MPPPIVSFTSVASLSTLKLSAPALLSALTPSLIVTVPPDMIIESNPVPEPSGNVREPLSTQTLHLNAKSPSAITSAPSIVISPS